MSRCRRRCRRCRFNADLCGDGRDDPAGHVVGDAAGAVDSNADLCGDGRDDPAGHAVGDAAGAVDSNADLCGDGRDRRLCPTPMARGCGSRASRPPNRDWVGNGAAADATGPPGRDCGAVRRADPGRRRTAGGPWVAGAAGGSPQAGACRAGAARGSITPRRFGCGRVWAAAGVGFSGRRRGAGTARRHHPHPHSVDDGEQAALPMALRDWPSAIISAGHGEPAIDPLAASEVARSGALVALLRCAAADRSGGADPRLHRRARCAARLSCPGTTSPSRRAAVAKRQTRHRGAGSGWCRAQYLFAGSRRYLEPVLALDFDAAIDADSWTWTWSANVPGSQLSLVRVASAGEFIPS